MLLPVAKAEREKGLLQKPLLPFPSSVFRPHNLCIPSPREVGDHRACGHNCQRRHGIFEHAAKIYGIGTRERRVA